MKSVTVSFVKIITVKNVLDFGAEMALCFKFSHLFFDLSEFR